ncbi:MAG TPA: hypothetical protein VI248_27040 [Kineosporiaceae bacterium]
MSTRRTDRPDDPGFSPQRDPGGDPGPGPGPARPRTEPVVALLATASAGAGQLLENVDALWVVLDIAAVLGAVAAIAMLLRALAASRGQPALAELGTGVVTAGLCAAVLLLAQHGPEARLGALVLEVATAMGALLTSLIVAGAVTRLVRERTPASGTDQAGEPAIGRTTGWVTVLAAVLAVTAVATDIAVR